MANFQDLQKMVTMTQNMNPQKIILGTNLTWGSQFQGTRQNLQKYRIYSLTPSNGPKNISNDELFQKMKFDVCVTANLTPQKTRDLLYDKLHQYYPKNNKIVIVWNAGNICHTSWKGSIAHAVFKTSQDKSYGHDVLGIIY